MVHDDDIRPIRPVIIRAGEEPIITAPPRDQQTLDVILETARSNRPWGRLTILEDLQDRGYDIEEAEVNYVLHEYKLPNLHQ